MPRNLLLNLTGHDRPGVTAALFEALPRSIEVRDVEQVVVDGLLTLGVQVSLDDAAFASQLLDAVSAALQPLGIVVSSVEAEAHESSDPSNPHVVTVLADPLTALDFAALARAISETCANIDRIERIASYPLTALELKISGVERAPLRSAMALLSASSGLDIAVQAGGLNRRGRHLVVLDVDSTVIQDEVVELLAAKAGALDEVARITASAMRGEIDFNQSLSARVALLAGLPESVFAEVYSELRLTPGARTLFRVLQSMEYEVALVSGGFAQVVGPLADSLGVKLWAANMLEVQDGKLTGRVTGDVVDRAGKATWLRTFAEQAGVSLERTIAIGDGANDLDMLALAGLGIAFNAKPVVQASADTSVNHPYLDSVLFFLGITRAEIESLSDRR